MYWRGFIGPRRLRRHVTIRRVSRPQRRATHVRGWIIDTPQTGEVDLLDAVANLTGERNAPNPTFAEHLLNKNRWKIQRLWDSIARTGRVQPYLNQILDIIERDPELRRRKGGGTTQTQTKKEPREYRSESEVLAALRRYIESKTLPPQVVNRFMTRVKPRIEAAYDRQQRWDDAYFDGKSFLDELLKQL